MAEPLTPERTLRHIEGEGCDAAAYHGLPMPAWDTCLDYEYVEERPTGDPFVDRCHRCLAHATLDAARAAAPLDVERLFSRYLEHHPDAQDDEEWCMKHLPTPAEFRAAIEEARRG